MATSADYRLGEYAFPRGWFAVATASELGRKPTGLRFFGQDMVAYRGESGRALASWDWNLELDRGRPFRRPGLTVTRFWHC